MKKIISLILLIIFSVSLSGCDMYGDSQKKEMKLIEIKVYDKDNNEIVGTYENYWTFRDEIAELSTSSELMPLNSAAPVENYYCVDAIENEAYTVKFIFYSKKNYELTRIGLSNEPGFSYIETIECTNIEKVRTNYVATIVVEKVDSTNMFFHVVNWSRGGVTERFHTMGGNTYIKGVYFNLNSTKETAC